MAGAGALAVNYLNQLTRVQQGTAVTTYTYDARGNQTQQVQTGTGVTTTSTYGYDLANRLISSGISNNAVNPLSTSATYAHNAQGQRVTRVEDEVVAHFHYTGSALLFTTVNEYVLQTQNILDPSGIPYLCFLGEYDEISLNKKEYSPHSSGNSFGTHIKGGNFK